MLKKEYRLKKKYQFNYTFKTGRTVGARHLLICFTKSKNKFIKIGLSVTKKVGKAVTRNAVKRRLRAAIAPLIPSLIRDYNLIIIARPNIVEAKYSEIVAELEYCVKKASLIRNENL